MYVKLFDTLLDSSLWMEDNAVLRVFLTMLLKCDLKGFVRASIPGLARAANVSLVEAQEAIKRLESPDEFSQDSDHDGRRIERVVDDSTPIWLVLNYEKYRNIKESTDRTKEYQAAYKRKKRATEKNAEILAVNEAMSIQDGQTSKKMDKTGTREKEREKNTSRSSDDEQDGFEEFWSAYPRKQARAPSRKKWKNMTKKDRSAALDALPRHIRAWEVARREPDKIPMPSTWLNQRRWEDELEPQRPSDSIWSSFPKATVQEP